MNLKSTNRIPACDQQCTHIKVEPTELSSNSTIEEMSSVKGLAPYFGIITVQLAYGIGNILSKIALEERLSTIVFIVYRHLIAMSILGPLSYMLERKGRPTLSLSILGKIFILALFGSTIQLNLFFAGLNYTSPTVAAAMGSVIPTLTFILALLLKMEKVSIGSAKGRAKIIGALVCVSGALLFTFWKGKLLGGIVERPLILLPSKASGHVSRHGKDDWIKGSILILTSNVACTAWIILQAMVYEVYPARLSINTLVCFFASLQSSVLGLIFERNRSSWYIGWNMQLVAVIYSGIVISGLTYYLQMYCISKKGPVFASMFNPLLLVIASVLSALFFAEKFHLGSLIGAFLIILGLYCVLWGKSKDLDANDENPLPKLAEQNSTTGNDPPV